MLELKALGPLDLVRGDGVQVRSVLAQPKRTALLVYLAVERPGEFHRRDTLLATFWPERDRDHARNALNQSLHFLRRSLGPGVIETRGRDEVGLAEGELWCDVVAFRQAIGEGARERALELYRGDLLEGFHVSGAPPFERWIDCERSGLRRMARDAAVELAREQREAPDEARRWLQRALEIAPTDERIVRRLMQLLDGAGDRAGALRAYEALDTRLDRTLGTEPSPETRALAAEIRKRKARHRTGTTPAAGGREARDERPGEAPPPRTAPRGGRAATPAPSRDSRRRRLRVAAGLVVLAAAGLVLFGVQLLLSGNDSLSDVSASGPESPLRSGMAGAGTDAGRPDRRTVGVLPFDDLSPDRSAGYFADGLAEEILHRLARSSGLRVVARASSFRFTEPRLDARAIGDSLGVETLLEGSVRRSGDRLRITAQLIDAEDGYHLWSGSYDLRLHPDELFEVQERIAQAIADTLRVRLEPDPDPRRPDLPTSDLEAYSLYLQGRHHWARRTPDSFRRAVGLYEAALQRDSLFVPAWTGLAQLYVLILTSPNVASLAPDFVTRYEAHRRAREAVDRALELDPTLPEAHTALGQVLRIEGDEDGAEAAFRRAIELNPSASTARQWLAFLLATRGEGDEALEHMRTAHLLDPFSVSINGDLGRFLYYAGEYQEAIRRLRRTLDLGPYPQAERFLALALSGADRHEEAERVAGALDPDVHDPVRARRIQGVVAARAGREGEAREILASWKRELETGDASPAAGEFDRATVLNIARIHAALEEPDSALAWLERAEEWKPGARLEIRNDPLFASLRADPNSEERE